MKKKYYVSMIVIAMIFLVVGVARADAPNAAFDDSLAALPPEVAGVGEDTALPTGVAGATSEWWAAAQAYIEGDMGINGVAGISTTADWSATGQKDGDKFGYSVAGAGDVNGDGYADVIVGAYEYTDIMFTDGKAYAFYGSATGLSTTPDWSDIGELGGGFGYSVAGAGDVNGDGYSDVIISAPLYSSAGRVYIFFGSASGLGATWDWKGTGEHGSDHFGISVAGAGDVNGDGYADVIVGADYYGEYFSGRVYVYHGSASGPGTTWNWSKTGADDYRYLGISVAGAGDVNGDGYADIIIASLAYFDQRGIAYVFHGSASGLESTASWTKSGENAYDRFGRSLASAGDVNGDGYGDIIVGADGFNDNDDNDGRVYIFNGSSTGVSSTASWYVEGLVPGVADQLGRSVASAGDVNGDGYADVVVGGVDRAMMYYGSATGPDTGWPDWYPSGENSGDMFGFSVAGAGDVNGDGYADIIVGAYGYVGGAEKGKAYVYLGSGYAPSSFEVWDEHGTYTGDEFGWVVASAGDVNADGYSDVIVSAPGYPAPSEKGRVYLYLGSVDGLETTPVQNIDGENDGDRFGSSIAAAGDVNGDGYGDVIVGVESYDNPPKSNVGKVYVYYGSASPPYLGTTADWSVTGEGGGLGWLVDGAGDVNGDGYADVVVSAKESGPSNCGTVYVYHGSESGLSQTPDWSKTGEQDFDRLGYSLAGAGDVNGDGYADIVVGTPYFGDTHGKAYAYYGSASGLSDTAAWSVTGVDSTDKIGSSLAAAGDVNGDGYADVVMGALKSPNANYPGKVYVYTGSASGLEAIADWSAIGQNNGDLFGYSVAGAGDVNGDGYADIVVGAYQYSSVRGKTYIYLGSTSGLDSTAVSTDQGEDVGDEFGYSVAGAGDVNGDGFADVIAGAPYADKSMGVNEGKAYAYFGNKDPGRRVTPQQARSDGSRQPVQPWGLSHAVDRFYLTVQATSPMGRNRVKLEVEACPPGEAFGETACVYHVSGAWKDVTATSSGTLVATTISGLDDDTLYHWRVRVLYAPYAVTEPGITPPLNPVHGPWRRFLGQGMEADLRTAACTFDWFVEPTNVAEIGSPGGTVTYNLMINNNGDCTDSVDVSVSGNAWTTNVTSPLGPLGAGQSLKTSVTVEIPAGAGEGDSDQVTVTFTSQGDPGQTAISTLTTTATLQAINSSIYLPLVIR